MQFNGGHMARNDSGGVTIGNVGGDIQGSVFVGRDLYENKIEMARHAQAADKQPTIDELKTLLQEVQSALLEIRKLRPDLQADAALNEVSIAAEQIRPEVKAEEAASIQERIKNAATTVGNVLEGVRDVSTKVTQTGSSLKPIAETLGA